ncbi:exodeoxyribonuclease III [Wenxinia marina]|uniref:Exodeoxyribonuclease III n=1 Tax=Wenxinia marina DSM 24838 TaxID=1123501 RepID=A0A0D0NP12_9RHOB|nr:exodeoxyribonuclease III [Wenxinia marina]KIQ70030.1 exodeoxyribonuclease III [Wenxinia marina DSM 24838]GGL62967.1 exodeoxyribonuclease III [Wenxinia marina]
MRIATWNINDVRKRVDLVLEFLAEVQPDALCLQELKCEDGAFPADAFEAAGYGAVWRGQRTWNGVAILGRGRAPVLVRDTLPGDPDDREARYIEAAVEGVLIACLYAPNGNPQPGPKFERKLAWTDRFVAHAAALWEAGVPAVLAGDYNIAPTAADVYEGHSYDDNALIQPGPRAQWERLVAQGWVDAVRAGFPDGEAFTFWDYRRRRWENDKGLRLDHLLLSGEVAPRLREVCVDRPWRGRENASDHAPVWVDLR